MKESAQLIIFDKHSNMFFVLPFRAWPKGQVSPDADDVTLYLYCEFGSRSLISFKTLSICIPPCVEQIEFILLCAKCHKAYEYVDLRWFIACNGAEIGLYKRNRLRVRRED